MWAWFQAFKLVQPTNARHERAIMHHYLHASSDLIVAVANPHHNPWLEKHLLTALTSPRGHSPACDALQIGLLAVGSTHLKYLARESCDPGSQLSNPLRGKVLGLVAQASGTVRSMEEVNMMLGALLSSTIASVGLTTLSDGEPELRTEPLRRLGVGCGPPTGQDAHTAVWRLRGDAEPMCPVRPQADAIFDGPIRDAGCLRVSDDGQGPHVPGYRF